MRRCGSWPPGTAGLGRTEEFAAVPGVRRAAPAVRSEMPLSGSRAATVLALDTARAADSVLIRPDLRCRYGRCWPGGSGPQGVGGAGGREGARGHGPAAADGDPARFRRPGTTADVTVTLEDALRHPVPGPGRRTPLRRPGATPWTSTSRRDRSPSPAWNWSCPQPVGAPSNTVVT